MAQTFRRRRQVMAEAIATSGLARPAGVLIVLAQGALLLVLRHALATCREHEAKLAALPPAQEAR